MELVAIPTSDHGGQELTAAYRGFTGSASHRIVQRGREILKRFKSSLSQKTGTRPFIYKRLKKKIVQ